MRIAVKGFSTISIFKLLVLLYVIFTLVLFLLLIFYGANVGKQLLKYVNGKLGFSIQAQASSLVILMPRIAVQLRGQYSYACLLDSAAGSERIRHAAARSHESCMR